MEAMMKGTLLLSAAALAILGAAGSASAASIEDVSVWRTQLKIHTCNQSTAGTDSHVSVRLNDFQSRPFYLRHAGDKGQDVTNTYDIFIPEVTRIRHITKLAVEIHGSNRWCFDRLELLVNANPGGTGGNVYAIPIFVSTEIVWLDRTNGAARFTRSSAALRAHPNWTDFVGTLSSTPPKRIKRVQVEGMVTGIVGDFVARDPDLQWGGLNNSSYVELTPPTTLSGVLLPARFDLDLERQNLFERNVDVDFTLITTCLDFGASTAIELRPFDFDVSGRAAPGLLPCFDSMTDSSWEPSRPRAKVTRGGRA